MNCVNEMFGKGRVVQSAGTAQFPNGTIALLRLGTAKANALFRSVLIRIHQHANFPTRVYRGCGRLSLSSHCMTITFVSSARHILASLLLRQWGVERRLHDVVSMWRRSALASLSGKSLANHYLQPSGDALFRFLRTGTACKLAWKVPQIRSMLNTIFHKPIPSTYGFISGSTMPCF